MLTRNPPHDGGHSNSKKNRDHDRPAQQLQLFAMVVSSALTGQQIEPFAGFFGFESCHGPCLTVFPRRFKTTRLRPVGFALTFPLCNSRIMPATLCARPAR